MSNSLAYRYGYQSGDPNAEAHHAVTRDIGGTSARILRAVVDVDALDWGTSTTGSVLNAATGDKLGTYISCDGKSRAVFKIELSAAGLVRRFRAMYRDKKASPWDAPGELYETRGFGPANGPTSPAAPTIVTGYFHGNVITVPTLGYKEVTLWLLDGLTAPTLHVWGAAG